jgi:DUF1680 family protein
MKKKISLSFIWILVIGAMLALVCTSLAQEAGFGRGNAPAQPADMSLTSIAGPDRVVMLEGKTYLNGYAGYGQPRPRGGGGGRRGQAAQTPEPTVIWSKESGLGTVTFENANAKTTTAKFSALGTYVLKLTANNGQTSASSTLTVKVEAPPPKDRLDVVYTKSYKIDNPLWNSRAKALIVGWIPHCIDIINTPDYPQGPGGIDNFIDAAKALRGEPLEEGQGHRGYVFSNAWVHQTVESMCIAMMVDPQGDQEIIKAQGKFKETLEDWIPKILAAQDKDGYLQTAFVMRRVTRNRDGSVRYDNGPFERWSVPRRGDHEGYVAGYFIESAINHYTLTNGKDLRLYNAAKKLCDCWVANIGPEPDKKKWYDGHQEMEQALVRFGRFVNDMEGGNKGDSYIKLAKFLLDCRGGGSEYDQSLVPVQQQYEAVGHSVRAAYTYSGMADIAAETHDVDYQSAVKSLWDNIVNKKYYVTGGLGSGQTSEGFGPNYELQNNAYCESCANCGELFFQWKMNLAYHDAKYADLYEETLYNAVMGDIDLKGLNLCYTNPLEGNNNRQPWQGCPCCVGNVPRTMLMIPTWTYVKGPDGIYVNLFIGGTINVEKVAGTDIQMVQKTNYPWSGDISIIVNPKETKRFMVYVRIPNRDTSELYTYNPDVSGLTSLAVNGEKITPQIDKGYAAITREWKAGDKIDLVLPMKVQRIKADERIEVDRGKVALRYGPLIYNVERVDQDIDQVKLSLATALTAEFNPNLLDGIVTIKGTWSDGGPLLAIPYYARYNRGEGQQNTSEQPAPQDAGQRRGRGMQRRSSSIVWMFEQQ